MGGGSESKIDQALPNHTKALELVSGFLGDAFHGVSPADASPCIWPLLDDLHRVWGAFIAALERVSAFHRVRLAGLCIRRVCGRAGAGGGTMPLSSMVDTLLAAGLHSRGVWRGPPRGARPRNLPVGAHHVSRAQLACFGPLKAFPGP